MAEMLIQSENLVAIADKIRVLSGTEENMSLNAMESHIDEANTNVATEADLIAQIASALEGKASGGGSISYDTCTVSIIVPNGALYGYCATCFDGSNIIYKNAFSNSNLSAVNIENVICGSTLALIHIVSNGGVEYSSNLSLVGSFPSRGSVFIAPTDNGTLAQIRIGEMMAGGD